MALSNRKIIDEIQAGTIHVGLSKGDKIPIEHLHCDTTSLELHLGNEFKVWKKPLAGEEISVDPSNPNFDFSAYAQKYTEDGARESDGSFILHSKEFVLCKTLEYIKLPPKYSARVEGKSKLARLGVAIHITAPTIHADWGGRITLEIYNHSPIAVRLQPGVDIQNPGLTIAQLIFEPVDGEITQKPTTFSQDQESSLGRVVGKLPRDPGST